MAVPQRIVSLVPSGTEILCALGLESRLVGVSQTCAYPPVVLSLPHLTPESAALRALQPDLVLTPGPDPLRDFVDAEVLALRPTLLQDIWDDIHRVGEVTGQQRQAATLLEALFLRVNALVAESIRLPETPRVALLVDTSPLRLGGDWLPDLLQIAGGSAGLCRPGMPAATVTWAQLQAYAPEVLVLSPMHMTLAEMSTALVALQRLPGWQELPAVQARQVIGVDSRTALHCPGPRIVDSLELLAGLIHPDLFGEYLQQEGELYEYLAP
jgi:iron complex transport system substrate-binding protein